MKDLANQTADVAKTRTAVLLPNWIGDLAMALAVIHAKAAAGTEAISLLTPHHLVGLCRRLTDLSVIPYDRRTGRARHETLRQVRRERFDGIYLLPYSFSSGWFAFRSRIPRRRGICRDARRLLLTEPLPDATRDYKRHITLEFAKVLDTEPVAVEHLRGRPVSPDKEHVGDVVLCPGARYGPAKRWGGFAELARALTGERIAVLGGPDDAAEGELVKNAAPDRVVNLCGKTTPAQAVSVLSAARLIVSNDSGLMHLAAYVGTPTIGIYGSTDPAWTRPIGPRVSVVYRSRDCSPCLDRECRYGHYRCLGEITVSDVLALCRRGGDVHAVRSNPASAASTDSR